MPDRNPGFELPRPPRRFFEGRTEMASRLNEAMQRGLHAKLSTKPSAVILSDIEGCLNFDPRTYDHDLLAGLREINEGANWSNALPFITLCTGRQAPFVDAFSAFLSVRLPIIFEGGCGLFFPTEPPGDRHRWHPLIANADTGHYQQLEALVMRTASDTGAKMSLGKGRLLTFHPRAGESVDELVDAFTTALRKENIAAEITRSANAVDISVAGITKGTAVSWLLDTIAERGGPKLSVAQVIGIGDAPNDLSFLDVVGMSAAPANADERVAVAVDIRSEYTDAKAVAEIVIAAIDRNLATA
jgi:3-deoxy-D-manno-octulosonate 8-phosphate phosphatase KdsC-like HAD superfamily phosphatase